MFFVNKTLVIVLGLISVLAIGAILVYVNNKGGLKMPGSGNISQELTKFEAPQGDKSQVNQNNMPQITELIIEDINEGTGSAVVAGNTAEVNYLGTLLTGEKFDSSYDRNQTFSFKVGAGEVIQGWDQGLIGMKIGGKRKLTIPSSLAYGPQAVGGIPANSPLLFEVELVSIK